MSISSASALRTILVTGANKGIGRALVQTIVDAHVDVNVLLGSRDVALGEKARAAIGCERVSVLQLDVSDDESVRRAVEECKGIPIYAIVNNAGIGFGRGFYDTINTNYIGTKRVCEAFIPLLEPNGRIVNTASASGPNFVNGLEQSQMGFWTSPATTQSDLDAKAASTMEMTDYSNEAYGFSKAAVNVYTRLLAEKHADLLINAQTPGWIATDLTKGMGANKPPSEGCVAAMKLLFDDLRPEERGFYFGSDGLRSPIDRYRDPGTPEYNGD